jgi:hypothetical protein
MPRNVYKIVVGKSESKRLLMKLTCKWEDNIKINLLLNWFRIWSNARLSRHPPQDVIRANKPTRIRQADIYHSGEKQNMQITLKMRGADAIVSEHSPVRYHYEMKLVRWVQQRAGRPGSIPNRCKWFSLLHSIQTGSGGNSWPPIHWLPGTLYPAVERPGSEADH